MFNLCDEPGAANGVVTYGDRPGLRSRCVDVAQSDTVAGIDVRSLPADTVVVVDTRNSRYRFVMLDARGRHALVEGGRHFPQEATVGIEGSTPDGSLVKVGWIGLGSFLELSSGARRIVTSRICSISVSR